MGPVRARLLFSLSCVNRLLACQFNGRSIVSHDRNAGMSLTRVRLLGRISVSVVYEPYRFPPRRVYYYRAFAINRCVLTSRYQKYIVTPRRSRMNRSSLS